MWGATGGLGQLRRPARAERRGTPGRRGVLAREGGAAPRPRGGGGDRPQGGRTTGSGRTSTPRTSREWRRLGKDIRALVGDDPDIVFEHPGRQTMGASVFVAKRGGDDRHLRGDVGLHDRVRQPPPVDEAEDDQGLALRQLPRGVGRQPAGLRGQDRAARCRPSIPLDEVGEAAYQVHHNLHEGKIGVLCLAPTEGLGHRRPRAAGPGRARTASPCSGGTGRERPRRTAAGLRRGRCSPRSTTWPSPCATSTPPSPSTRGLRRRGGPPRGGRARTASKRRSCKVADSYVQLLTPTATGLAGGEVPGQQGRGPPPRRLPGGRLRGGAPER